MNSPTQRQAGAATAAAPGQGAATAKIQLLACGFCGAPVIKGAGQCNSCATPQNGKEYPYIVRAQSRPELQPLFKWWGIWSIGIWVVSGFSLGKISSVLLTLVAVFYLVRILRAYYSE